MHWRTLLSTAFATMGISSNSKPKRPAANQRKSEVTFDWSKAVSSTQESLPASYHRDEIIFASSHGGDSVKEVSSRSNSQWNNPVAGVSNPPIKHPHRNREPTPYKLNPYGLPRLKCDCNSAITKCGTLRKASSVPSGPSSYQELSHSVKSQCALQRLGLSNVSLPMSAQGRTESKREKVVKTHGCKIWSDPSEANKLRIKLDSVSEDMKLSKGCRIWSEDGNLVVAYEPSTDRSTSESSSQAVEEDDATCCSDLAHSSLHDTSAAAIAQLSKAVSSTLSAGKPKEPEMEKASDADSVSLSLSMNCSSYPAPSNVTKSGNTSPVFFATSSIQCDMDQITPESVSMRIPKETLQTSRSEQVQIIQPNFAEEGPSLFKMAKSDMLSVKECSVTESITITSSTKPASAKDMSNQTTSLCNTGRAIGKNLPDEIEDTDSLDSAVSSDESGNDQQFVTPGAHENTSFHSFSSSDTTKPTEQIAQVPDTCSFSPRGTDVVTATSQSNLGTRAGSKRTSDEISTSTTLLAPEDDITSEHYIGPTRMKVRVFHNEQGDPVWQMTLSFNKKPNNESSI